MKRIFILFSFVLLHLLIHGQIINRSCIQKSSDSSMVVPDTLKSFLIKKEPPFLFNANLNYQGKAIGNKILRGCLYSSGYDIVILSALVFAPESISKWENRKEKFKFSSIMNQYKDAYTKPPVIDKDLFITNYAGHPYQGAFYYNTMRSQGSSILQSSLFCLGQAVLWEYGWEACVEQPSIQDLITTPLAGILVGELSHVATIAMSKNGFRWYEIIAVCIINPAYAINNHFKFNKRIKTY